MIFCQAFELHLIVLVIGMEIQALVIVTKICATT